MPCGNNVKNQKQLVMEQFRNFLIDSLQTSVYATSILILYTLILFILFNI